MAIEKKQLAQTIAGVERDPFTAIFQGLMRPNDDVLLSRGGISGLKVYDEIERDCHAYSVLQKRKHAVISFPWEIEPASPSLRDRKAAEGIKAILQTLDFDGLCLGLLDALLKGFAVAEVLWDPSTWLPARVVMRNQRRFLFDTEGRPRLAVPSNMLPGEELPERKFIVHRFGAKDGNPYGLGLGSKLFWPTFFKRQGISFWLVFAEKFGTPTVLGKYPEGMTEERQGDLLRTLSDLAQETAIVAPLEAEIDLLEAARAGSIDTYERLVRYMDEEVSKAVLGETLTTTMGSVGSYAASATHNDVRLELTRSDADLLSGTLHDSLLTWLRDLHFPGAGVPRLWRKVQEATDLKAEAEKDQIVAGMGFEPDEAWIQEKYGQGWKRKAKPEPPPQLLPPQPEASPEPGAAFSEAAPDLADAMTDRAEVEGTAAFAKLLEPVRRLVAQATSLEAIRDGLLDLYPAMEQAAFAELLTDAFMAANLGGRFEARNDR